MAECLEPQGSACRYACNTVKLSLLCVVWRRQALLASVYPVNKAAAALLIQQSNLSCAAALL
jgi:hypothetical protein